jgi:hypothetical protein
MSIQTKDKAEGVFARLGTNFGSATLPVDDGHRSLLSVSGDWGAGGEEAIINAVVYLHRPLGSHNRDDYRLSREYPSVILSPLACQVKLSLFRRGSRADLKATVAALGTSKETGQ